MVRSYLLLNNIISISVCKRCLVSGYTSLGAPLTHNSCCLCVFSMFYFSCFFMFFFWFCWMLFVWKLPSARCLPTLLTTSSTTITTATIWDIIIARRTWTAVLKCGCNCLRLFRCCLCNYNNYGETAKQQNRNSKKIEKYQEKHNKYSDFMTL